MKEDWKSVPPALATVLLSLALAGWIMNVGEKSSETATPRLEPGTAEPIATPLAPSRFALMLGSHSEDVLFGLAAVPGGPVDVVAVTSDLKRVEPISLAVFAPGSSERSSANVRSCGFGCSRLETRALAGEPMRVVVRARRPSGLARAEFRLPSRLPQSGNALLGRVNRVMGSLDTLRMQQALSSGKQLVRATYSFQAPDRVRFVTSTGAKTVLIGKRRWDFEDGRWVSDQYPGADVPTYPWEGATHPRIIGTGVVRGRAVTFLVLFKADPSVPAWFRLAVARDGRVLRADMVAPGHFMTDSYRDFNAQISIQPPS